MTASEDHKKQSNFAKIPNEVVTSESWAQWSDKARAVYIVLLIHAYTKKDGMRKAILSVATIAKESGKSTDSIAPAVKELTLSGWVSVKKGGPKIKYMNVYSIFMERHLPDLARQVSQNNTSRSYTVKCQPQRVGETGRFAPIPGLHRTDTSRVYTGTDTSRSYTVKKKSTEDYKDVDAGSASACQGQASPALTESDAAKGFIGKTIDRSGLKFLIKLPFWKEIVPLIRTGDILLEKGINIDEVAANYKGVKA